MNMNNKKCFFICGGDLRQVSLAEFLQEDGFDVVTYGFDKIKPFGVQCKTVAEGARKADVVVLPLPAVVDKKINMPFSDESLSLEEFADSVGKCQLILAGMADNALKSVCGERCLTLLDYFDREELAILNAIPTAEGAIQIAMEETPHTIQNSRCLVLGYGRVGRILAQKLNALGADVSVSVRQLKDLAWIKAEQCTPIDLKVLDKHIGSYDIIINTIPYMTMNSEILQQVNKKSIIIDLASKPGGVDFEAAGRLGLNVIWALSLPGKIAPRTSANIIKDTILNMISELEV